MVWRRFVHGLRIATDSKPTRYSIYHHKDRIEKGDLAAVFQFGGADGAIVVVWRIKGRPAAKCKTYFVPWEVRKLSAPILGSELKLDGAWAGRQPLIKGNMVFANPTRLDADRRNSILARLSPSDRKWLKG